MKSPLIPLLLLLAACAPIPAERTAGAAVADDLEPRIATIEVQSGGRLGMALYSPAGGLLLSHRGDERFAMCSTFKLALAAVVLDTPGLRAERLPFGADDILGYAPYAKERAGEGWMSGYEAAHHAVTLSDNTAANLLLARLGGPAGFTQWLRAQGDVVTRLDRNEPALNENAPGDLRDTTSPAAHAALVANLLWGDRLGQANREQLMDWLVETPTGADRLRAGLPHAWHVGDKTGTCGTGEQGAVNDIAAFQTPSGRRYVLATYLDRPDGQTADAEARLAEVAAAVAGWLAERGA